jgi:antitoxin VapB
MPMNIRDPRAEELARKLASLRDTTMTRAVIEALESELDRERRKRPLAERVALLRARHLSGRTPATDLAKDQIDELWGS